MMLMCIHPTYTHTTKLGEVLLKEKIQGEYTYTHTYMAHYIASIPLYLIFNPLAHVTDGNINSKLNYSLSLYLMFIFHMLYMSTYQISYQQYYFHRIEILYIRYSIFHGISTVIAL